MRVDVQLAADLGIFSKPWVVTVEDFDVILELVGQAGIDRDAASSAIDFKMVVKVTTSPAE